MTSQYETNLWSTHDNIVRLAELISRCVRWRTPQNRGVCLQAFPSFPSPSPLFHFLALISFFARPKLVLAIYAPCFYKITKIVRALWLAKRSVCMRVCKHGFTSRCFVFRALITQAWIWKSFRVQSSTSFLYLPIPSSAETWKIVTKKVCQFFSLKLTF